MEKYINNGVRIHDSNSWARLKIRIEYYDYSMSNDVRCIRSLLYIELGHRAEYAVLVFRIHDNDINPHTGAKIHPLINPVQVKI